MIIELHGYGSNDSVYINTSAIVDMTDWNGVTVIYLSTTKRYLVTETITEVVEMVNNLEQKYIIVP